MIRPELQDACLILEISSHLPKNFSPLMPVFSASSKTTHQKNFQNILGARSGAPMLLVFAEA